MSDYQKKIEQVDLYHVIIRYFRSWWNGNSWQLPIPVQLAASHSVSMCFRSKMSFPSTTDTFPNMSWFAEFLSMLFIDIHSTSWHHACFQWSRLPDLVTSLCALHTAAVTGTVDESADAEPLGRGLADYLLPSLSSRDLNSLVEFPLLRTMCTTL